MWKLLNTPRLQMTVLQELELVICSTVVLLLLAGVAYLFFADWRKPRRDHDALRRSLAKMAGPPRVPPGHVYRLWQMRDGQWQFTDVVRSDAVPSPLRGPDPDFIWKLEAANTYDVKERSRDADPPP